MTTNRLSTTAMTPFFKHTLPLALACLLLTGCYYKTDSAPGTWARGADLSWLSEMEHDAMFDYDCIDSLRALGMNAVRLRVWVNHRTGWSNKADMLSLARRAAEHGQRLMIDIHYSDFFADPNHQDIPEAWLDYDYELLCEAVREHTLDVLNSLKEAGIRPEWVQIGNETPNGMLWPVARLLDKEDNSNGCWDRYAGLTAVGYRAAKEVFPDIVVIVHVDNAYERRDWFWRAMYEHGGRWDMIGLSHYPMMSAWNGGRTWQEMNRLAEENIRRLIRDWHCPVMVAEIGMFADDSLSAVVMEDFVRRASAIDSCAGIFYWEPECYGGWRPAEYVPLGWGGYDMGAFTPEGRPSEVMRILLRSDRLQRDSADVGEQMLDMLNEQGLSLLVYNDSTLSTHADRGVQDLLTLIADHPDRLRGAVVADKVIGKAAAALMAAGGVREVHTNIICTPARRLLEAEGIPVFAREEVPEILNRDRSAMCPIDAQLTRAETVAECVEILRNMPPRP